ncbi:MAG: hypothetical protein AB7P60_20595 [Hyphomicrobiaceae bacterium]
MNTDDLNLQMCEFALARLAEMGERKGGLYNYYAVLSKAGRMLRPEEIAVAEYISRVMPEKTILELCSGAAQLGHLLSLQGRTVSAIEIDPLRHAFAVALGAHVSSKCSLVLGGWQSMKLSDYGLLVTLNAATSHIFPADTQWLVDYARGGGEFIIRPRQFGAGIPVEIPGLEATQVFEDVYHYRA